VEARAIGRGLRACKTDRDNAARVHESHASRRCDCGALALLL